MENSPFFSIITICKNAENLIEKTAISLMNQTFCDYQYIVVDGNSCDETVSRVKKIINKNKKLDYLIVSENDGGISQAMNKGLSYARGRFVFYLHAGDTFRDTKILEFVHHDFHINSWDWAIGSLEVVSIDDRVLHIYEPVPYSQHKIILFQNKIPHQAVFLNTIILKEEGGFDEDLTQAMDYDLWLRLLFCKGLAYHQLNFIVGTFLEGGRSKQIMELFTMLNRSRKKLKKTGLDISVVNNIKLYSIILAFLFYSKIKTFYIKLVNH